jgi:mycothiol synthase
MRRANLDDLPEYTLPAGCVLRAAEVGDEPGLAALLASAFESDWTPDRVRSGLTQAADVDTVFVIVCGSEVVATASSRLIPLAFPNEGYLHWVGVAPEARGKGLGRAVCVRALERFRELGCRGAVLETDDHRLPALRMYLGMGFVPAYRHPSDAERWAAVMRGMARR